MKTKNFAINTLWVLLLSLATSCNMLPDEPLFDAPVTPEEVGGTYNGHDYVDLGLSVKWATCNVGATKPEEYGGYYAWGETEEKDNYDWSTYKWCNGNSSTMTKYCTDSNYGTVDNKTVLDPEDDVAYVCWGDDWRMPTHAEFNELRDNCKWTWTTMNGVNGYKVTGSNGNSIFLPAAGGRYGTNLGNSGAGFYWSSSLVEGSSGSTCNLFFGGGSYTWGNGGRCYGFSVRPVCGEPAAPVEKCTVTINCAGNGSVAIKDVDGTSATIEVGSTVTIVATPDEGYAFDGWYVDGDETPVSTDAEYTFTVSGDVALTARFRVVSTYAGYEYVDLGLPSGLKWATCNVGATKPEEYGGYYAWGETEEKSSYSWSTYKWCNGSEYTMTKYCTSSSYGTVDNKTVLDPEDDVAHVKWGGSWRMPTKAEQDELRDNCTWTWTTQNGVNGYKVTSKTNSNSIFLPAAGYRDGTYLYYNGSYGYYWSSSLYGSNSGNAYYLGFDSGGYGWGNDGRYGGVSVRPVSGGRLVVEYTVSVTSAGNGSISIKDKSETTCVIEDGTVVTVMATPDEGYAFVGWYVDGNEIPVSTDTVYTMAVYGNISLVARFREKTYVGGYEYVDLGLPSGTKWATCNVGATKPEEYGGYYAWGETEEKEDYNWSIYKWCNGSSTSITKYCTNSNYGTVDNKTVLDPEDDVAHVKWGGSWRMPTLDEQDELCANCTWIWTSQNGVVGYKVISKTNGNSIFLPAAGYRYGTGVYSRGSHGYYWAGLLDGNSNYACYLYFKSGSDGRVDSYRYYGFSVRPVSK